MHFSIHRYGRDYYINDSKTASGSRTLRSSGNLNRHRTVDDDDNDGNGQPENDYDERDSVSDLDSFYSNRSERQYRYRYAHLPKPMTLQTNKTMQMQLPINDGPLKRSHSMCSVRTYGLRKRMNRHDYADSSQYTFDQPYEKPQHKHQPHGGQIIAQLERDTLHSDIWRSSFSSRRGTQNFVINPLYTDQNAAEI